MAHVDVKVTVWERYEFDDEFVEKVKAELEKGNQTGDEIFNFIQELQEDVVSQTLYDTNEYISPSENGGASTMELFLNEEAIYRNGDC